MYRLYDYLPSGNSYKPRLLLSLLGIEYERIDVDIMKGETRTPEFLLKNPNGRIPALQLENGEVLWESNAILYYLARHGTPYMPTDPLPAAQVMQWMFFEQYSHEPFIAVARFILMHTDVDSPRRAEMEQKMTGGYAALDVMEQHLASNSYFVDDTMSIADIALYAYTHVADEGGFDLSGYPAVNSWLARIAATPGYVGIDAA
ncbi:MAG: glutathione S-transferase family protein [Gammaproteobacteria bacterium]|nr:glutathione S-transferase family protein [Gammaproteobacteria bacterium]NNF61062.1 glutathione S-transferase family protein [Gammaproteobacteria bacterium]NNM21425.1 glutathione S-transferase family protein [Gammaproteobacteria bacterium]